MLIPTGLARLVGGRFRFQPTPFGVDVEVLQSGRRVARLQGGRALRPAGRVVHALPLQEGQHEALAPHCGAGHRVRPWIRMSFRLWLAIAVGMVTLAAMPARAAAAALNDPVSTLVPDGEVKAIALSGSTAYIGGNFSRIAPYTGSSALFEAPSGESEEAVARGRGRGQRRGSRRGRRLVPGRRLQLGGRRAPDGPGPCDAGRDLGPELRPDHRRPGARDGGRNRHRLRRRRVRDRERRRAREPGGVQRRDRCADGLRRRRVATASPSPCSIRLGSTHFSSSARRCTRSESSTRRRTVPLSRPACGGRPSTSPTVRSWRGIPAPTA